MQKKKAICTIVIAGINIVVFLGLSFVGITEDSAFMMEHGAIFVPFILNQGEYYRLFTAMFLHFGVSHLMNNMILLLVGGWTLEFEIGKIKFLLLYFLSGLSGNILSIMQDIKTEDYAVSAGASGAIFGIVGALLYIAIRNKGRIGRISGNRLLLIIVISLYNGFSTTGIDNMAHIGGLAGGFLIAVLLYRKGNSEQSTLSAA